MTKKEEWLAGTRSAVPIMLGYVPVGIAYGVMARQAGLNTWQTVLMSLTVYGGASEMMAAGMVAQGAAVLTIARRHLESPARSGWRQPAVISPAFWQGRMP